MEQKETRKTVRTFAIASFLNDFGSDIIYPIWPIFITTVLGANMAVLGLIDGLGEAFVSISKAASGYISDRMHRRKVFIWTGYLFGAASRVGYAFSTEWARCGERPEMPLSQMLLRMKTGAGISGCSGRWITSAPCAALYFALHFTNCSVTKLFFSLPPFRLP
jgi:MFS family permease